MKKRFWGAVSLFLVFCFLFTGCRAAEEEDSSARDESPDTVSGQEENEPSQTGAKEAQTCPHTPTQHRKYG